MKIKVIKWDLVKGSIFLTEIIIRLDSTDVCFDAIVRAVECH